MPDAPPLKRIPRNEMACRLEAINRRIEVEMPASELATSIQVALTEAAIFIETNGEFPQVPTP